ncbi:MAG TPA: hypothetical protein DCY13_01575 [Verrucomicrobiales bacterium]|nr:hypothetical protein [Verrucomicrobiales bacterium]
MNEAHHGANCEDACPASELCPLSHVPAGTFVRIKQLASTPEINDRLREMGFCEEREIRLISQSASLLCQVCNARLGLNPKIAQSIMVERVRPATRRVA